MPDWGWWLAGGLAGALVLWLALRAGLRALRRAMLMRRFGDAAMVGVIMEGQIAQGMTREMVMAAWGTPADMDETVLKTKTKAEMKYDPKGRNRFGTRVWLENGVVIGWETK